MEHNNYQCRKSENFCLNPCYNGIKMERFVLQRIIFQIFILKNHKYLHKYQKYRFLSFSQIFFRKYPSFLQSNITPIYGCKYRHFSQMFQIISCFLLSFFILFAYKVSIIAQHSSSQNSLLLPYSDICLYPSDRNLGGNCVRKLRLNLTNPSPMLNFFAQIFTSISCVSNSAYVMIDESTINHEPLTINHK